MEHGTPYVLIRSGMFYAHDSRGYVHDPALAELYTKSYAERRARTSEEVIAKPVTEVISGDRVGELLERLHVMQEAVTKKGKEGKGD